MIWDFESHAMHNNNLYKYAITASSLKACLLALLLSQPGFAQSTDGVQPATQGMDGSSPPPAKSDTKKKNNPTPKRPPATQFIPTEKLRADDAVAFPVDI